jgi:cyclopropane-fatty-acyl-phospholipid synthase
MSSFFENKARELLSLADVQINGARPWDIKVRDPRLFRRALTEGTLGLGESYMDGWWDCDQLDELFNKLLRADLKKKVRFNFRWILGALSALLFNQQTKIKSLVVGKQHYDVGNNLYTAMLDKRMTYTCGYWKNTTTLDQAQEDKLDLVCKKLNLKAGQRILDIGCGWGSFAKFAAEKYGVRVVGITISQEQVELGKKLCANLPVEIRMQDYRDINEKFDHIVSLGMFEHVGYRNYRQFMKVVDRCLKNDGLFLLHTIGSNHTTIFTDRWIHKYIFPNGVLPSIRQIGSSIENIFVMEDWHNFGPYYDNTLMAWHSNFVEHWDALKSKYDDRFYRMWTYYLLMCAGSFRARENELWQIVLSKNERKGAYDSVR